MTAAKGKSAQNGQQPDDGMTVSFDQIVKEAKRDPVRLPLPDGGEDVWVQFPTADVVEAVDQAFTTSTGLSDIQASYAAFNALLGEENGKRVVALLGPEPADVAERLLGQIFSKWDIKLGNSLGSSI